jgi:hypothetical protein
MQVQDAAVACVVDARAQSGNATVVLGCISPSHILFVCQGLSVQYMVLQGHLIWLFPVFMATKCFHDLSQTRVLGACRNPTGLKDWPKRSTLRSVMQVLQLKCMPSFAARQWHGFTVHVLVADNKGIQLSVGPSHSQPVL